MSRVGVIHCRQISENKYSIEWNFELHGNDIGTHSSPIFGLMCGAFNSCNMEIKHVRYSEGKFSALRRVTVLIPDTVVKTSPKLTFCARLLNHTGILVSSNKSKTWLTAEPRMKILEQCEYYYDEIKGYFVILDLELHKVTANDKISGFAKNNECLGKSHLNEGKNSIGDDFRQDVKKNNNSIPDSADIQTSGQIKVEYPEDLIQDLRSLYNTGLMSDINIRIGEDTLQTHKLILSARSPVFQKMLEHEFLESTSNCIIITDCKSTVFRKFLNFLYTGEIEDRTTDNVMELYTLADKYDVKGLRVSCSKILQSEFSSASVDHLIDIVANVLQLAECYSDSKLKDLAIDFITIHFPEVTNTQSWKEFLKKNSELASEVLAQVATFLRKGYEKR